MQERIEANTGTTQDLLDRAHKALKMLMRLHEDNEAEHGREWETFWKAFDYTVHSRNNDNIFKLNYLVDALQEESKESVKQFEISDSTYPLVIEHLNEKNDGDQQDNTNTGSVQTTKSGDVISSGLVRRESYRRFDQEVVQGIGHTSKGAAESSWQGFAARSQKDRSICSGNSLIHGSPGKDREGAAEAEEAKEPNDSDCDNGGVGGQQDGRRQSYLNRFHADISGRPIPVSQVCADRPGGYRGCYVRSNSAGGVRRTSLPGKQKMRVSIIPLETLDTAYKAGFDLNAEVEEIPLREKAAVYDVSGQKMTFKGAVRLTLRVSGRAKCTVALFVKVGGGGTLLPGANAFHSLGLSLTRKSVCPRRKDDRKSNGCTQNYYERNSMDVTEARTVTNAIVTSTVYVRPRKRKVTQSRRQRSQHDRDETRRAHRHLSQPSKKHTDDDRNRKDRGSSRAGGKNEDKATTSERFSSNRTHVKE
ncbi:unnamed protein product [Heligmosomoides polygyrus]|uniref:C2 NT-type domain-containing protein n=1 Tax=Heligmosomoides polygyrus TaxID=6339 RepID=A0A3P7ZVM9_HELPZ|nr:unnamed protein product [Heligmosomoides polygyrus]